MRSVVLALLAITAGCSADAVTGPPRVARFSNGVTVRAESQVMVGDLVAPTVQVRTIFTNPGAAPATVEPTNCVWVRLRARRVGDNVIVYDDTKIGYLCITNAPIMRLPPQGADTVVQTLTAADFAGQPASARFRLESFVYAAQLEANGEAVVAAGTVRIP
jgi:hypothetical protein